MGFVDLWNHPMRTWVFTAQTILTLWAVGATAECSCSETEAIWCARPLFNEKACWAAAAAAASHGEGQHPWLPPGVSRDGAIQKVDN